MRYSQLLKDKRVFVTGGSRGLGKVLCQTAAQQGARVAFNYSKDASGALDTFNKIETHGEGLRYQASVLDYAGLEQVVKDIESKWGGIDILINNAGISQPLPLALMDEDDWDLVMDTNVKGAFLTTKAFLRGMIRRKSGSILNIGSLAGIRLIEAPIHYSTSKAALKGFTQALAKEVGRYQIRVNCLAPGLLEGGVGDNLPEHRLKDFLRYVALHRRGTMEEVAKYAVFLASERNSYMNGATVLMDGGF